MFIQQSNFIIKPMKTVSIIILCLCTLSVFSQSKTSNKPKKQTISAKQKHKSIDEEGEMKTYYMVFLVKGENRTQDSTTAAEIQKQHLAHLDKMWKDGKLDIAGPFLDEGDSRGICIYNVKTLEEAKALAESDPAVKAGRLKVIVRAWYSMKGATLK